MKKTLLVAALALLAAGHAEAAPIHTRGIGQGNLTCTIAGSSNTKLFVQIQRTTARAAVRAYPYYGETRFVSLHLRSIRGTSATYGRGRESLSLRTIGNGVVIGTARIGGQHLSVTCSRG